MFFVCTLSLSRSLSSALPQFRSVVREFILIFLFWVVGGCSCGAIELYPAEEEKEEEEEE